jgi:hypothetical protein
VGFVVDKEKQAGFIRVLLLAQQIFILTTAPYSLIISSMLYSLDKDSVIK